MIIGSCVGLIFSFKDLVAKKAKEVRETATPDQISIKLITKNVRCYKEWIDYGIQLNFEIFFNEKVLLKAVYLDYKEPHGFGENWTQRAQIFSAKMMEDDLLLSDLQTVVDQLKNSVKLPELPQIFEEKSILQVTIGGFIPGERLPDGWEGITLSNWTLVIEFDENECVEIPLTLDPHCKSEKRPTEWKYVGFVNA